jgi:hypothetical protein
MCGKRSLALVVGFPMVEPAHPSSSPRLGMGVCIYLDLFQDLLGAILSVVGDVPVNSLKICRLSPSEVLIEVGCACVRS